MRQKLEMHERGRIRERKCTTDRELGRNLKGLYIQRYTRGIMCYGNVALKVLDGVKMRKQEEAVQHL